MHAKLALFFLTVICTSFFWPSIAIAKTYQVYFLGGQSNMEGYGYVRDLTPEQRQPHPNVMIFHGNPKFDDQPDGGIGMWADLRPGHGTGFVSDSKNNYYSLRYGPELTFGHGIADLSSKLIAIIKYSAGGTGLAEGSGYGNWSATYKDGKGINQFDNALKALESALSEQDIDNDGEADTLIPAGIVWMQGEADAHSAEAHANAYSANLTELMYYFRTALKKPKLPVVLGKINRSNMLGFEKQMPYIETVQKAHETFSKTDKCAAYVTDTDTYKFNPDGWHYDSEGFLKLGGAFAMAMHKLTKTCTKP